MANQHHHQFYGMGDDRMDELEEHEEYQDSDEDAEEEIGVFDEVMPEHQDRVYQNYLEQYGIRLHLRENNLRENNQSSLEKSMMQFIRHTNGREHVLEQSSTLRLVKALHEKKLEHVILAIEEGACINFKVCLMLLFFDYSHCVFSSALLC